MLNSLALILFPLAMIFAALADLFTMTIPNRLSLALIGAYFLLAIYLRIPLETIALHVSCGLAMLLLTFMMFHFRWIGGGDAKLAAATALWLGWGLLFDYGLIASLAGGVLTVIIIELRRHELPEKILSVQFIARLAEKNGGVPYGIALALAGLFIYPQTGVWMRLSGL
ncbi:MAG: prepilin peptidase [Methylocystis sp.]|jgi:prepilin peptidase CpaA